MQCSFPFPWVWYFLSTPIPTCTVTLARSFLLPIFMPISESSSVPAVNASSLETALCLLRVYISLGLYDTTSAPSGSYCNLRMRLPTIFSWQMEACRAHEEETTLSGGTAVLSDAFHEHWMWSCGSHLVSSPRNRKQVRWQQLHGLSKSRRAIAGSKLEVMTMGVEDHKNIIIKKKKKNATQ